MDPKEIVVQIAKAREDLENDVLFQEIVRDFCSCNPSYKRMMAEHLAVSLPTVNRWGIGASVPFHLMRKPVYNFIEETLVREITLAQKGSS